MTAPTPLAEDDEYGYIRDWLGVPGTVADAPPIWRDVDDLPDISGWREGAKSLGQ